MFKRKKRKKTQTQPKDNHWGSFENKTPVIVLY